MRIGAALKTYSLLISLRRKDVLLSKIDRQWGVDEFPRLASVTV